MLKSNRSFEIFKILRYYAEKVWEKSRVEKAYTAL